MPDHSRSTCESSESDSSQDLGKEQISKQLKKKAKNSKSGQKTAMPIEEILDGLHDLSVEKIAEVGDSDGCNLANDKWSHCDNAEHVVVWW